MPTPHQMKKIAAKTALVAAADRALYAEQFEFAQILKDLINNTTAEYVTSPWLKNLTDSMAEGYDPAMREIVMDVALNVAQDMLIQRFAGGDQRSFTHSLVLFGSSSVIAQQLQNRVEMFN